MYSDQSIIKDLRALTESFIPNRIMHRDGQIQQIRDNLAPLIDDKKPRNMFLYGPPGTGKTTLSKYVLDELQAHVTALTSYVNCWSYSSEFKILYNILQDFKDVFIHRQGVPADELLDRLRNKARSKPCIIILDEVDHIESDKILYELLNLNVCLIMIANNESALYSMEERVRSRTASADSISFPAYSEQEIFDIIKDRSNLGLVSGRADTLLLKKIAALSKGDCRFAIDMLRIAADEAEKKGMEKMQPELVDKFATKIKAATPSAMEKLNDYQKIIYNIISDGDEIKSHELHKKFEKLCSEKKLEIIHERTVRKHLERLEQYKLISAIGTGNGRIYSKA